jgi:hypothetical protein
LVVVAPLRVQPNKDPPTPFRCGAPTQPAHTEPQPGLNPSWPDLNPSLAWTPSLACLCCAPACLPLVLFLSQPPSSVCMTMRGMLSGSVQAAPLKATATQHCCWSGWRSYTLEPVYSAGSCVGERRQQSTAGTTSRDESCPSPRQVPPLLKLSCHIYIKQFHFQLGKLG